MIPMPLSAKLAYITAALCHLYGYYLYNRTAIRKQNDPNAASWLVWAVMAILNALTYRAITDTVSALQFIVGSFASSASFLFMWYHGRFQKISRKEKTLLGVALIMLMVWKLFDAPAVANVIFAITFVFSFIPTYDGVTKNPHKETATPWVWWSVGFVLTIIGATIVNKPWYAFVTPVALLVCHASITVLASPQRKLAFQPALTD